MHEHKDSHSLGIVHNHNDDERSLPRIPLPINCHTQHKLESVSLHCHIPLLSPLDISRTHSIPSRRHDDLLEEGLCRCTDTKWGWVVKLRLIGIWDQVVDRDIFNPVVWSIKSVRARMIKR